MPKATPINRDANRFTRPGSTPHTAKCHWVGCTYDAFVGTPVCLVHACMISELVDTFAEQRLEDLTEPITKATPPATKQHQPFVYYLMLSPMTVKIGTTRNLPKRLEALQSSAQYIVALEYGGRELEHQRHQQFTAERLDKSEKFHLSDTLTQHIEALQPQRDELMTIATTYPLSLTG